MATSYIFNGQEIIIPGSYSAIKSGIKNPTVNSPVGNLIVIDTGSGSTYGGGAGVDGEFSEGIDSLYAFDNIADFRNFAKGGLWWLLAQPLFRPAGIGFNGISKISFIKAATTLAARINYIFDDTEQSVSGHPHSTWNIAVTDEGVIGNGVLTSSNLSKGYGAKLSRGVVDTTTFIVTFYRGTYTGLDQNNLPFDGISAANSIPLVVAKSPECASFQELADWMAIDFLFNKSFKLVNSPKNLAGMPTDGDFNYYEDYNLAAGGTESYASTQLLTDTLTALEGEDVSFIFCDQYGADAHSAANQQILASIIEDSKFKPELYVAAGNDVNDFESISLVIPVSFNNDSVSVVHGGVYKQSKQGLRTYSAMYHAAAVIGREAGLASQVPITFKALDFDGMTHPLNNKEVKKALKKGLIVTRIENGTFDIVKGINSLQANTFLVNDNGTTHSKQIKRISRQLNKEIIINSRAQLLKDEKGVNRRTLSEEDVRAWLIGYLKTKKVTIDNDNLILSFQDITIVRIGDAYNTTYKFEPNTEISFLFTTGLIIGV